MGRNLIKGVKMNTEQKRYVLVFTGLFLMILGGLLFIKADMKKAKKNKKSNVLAYMIGSKEESPENIFVPCARPTKLNFVYDEGVEFKREIPLNAGLREYKDTSLDDVTVFCNGRNCEKQIVGKNNVDVLMYKKAPKPKVFYGNVMFSKGNLKYLKSGMKIVGDLYIKNLNFIRIPKGFKVVGNVYIENSDGVNFLGNNFVDGHIFLSGKSSLKALPKSFKMTGQIFM